MYALWLRDGLYGCSTNCGTWSNLYVLSLAWKMTTKQAAFFIWMDYHQWSQLSLSILNSLFEIPMFKVSALRGGCLHWTYKWLNYTDISDSKELFYPPILSSQPGVRNSAKSRLVWTTFGAGSDQTVIYWLINWNTNEYEWQTEQTIMAWCLVFHHSQTEIINQ